MTKRLILLIFIPAMFITCKGTPSSSSSFDNNHGELVFISRHLPDLTVPPEVGARSDDPNNEDSPLVAFCDAYRAALLWGIPLTGTLGNDRVSPWPSFAPLSWSQNWASADMQPNSWGMPGLVLALGPYNAAEFPDQVFLVYGQALDFYGKSAGINRANGVTGYGTPLGEITVSGGSTVQRFTRGRMIFLPSGESRFVFEEDKHTPLLRNLAAQEEENDDIPHRVSAAFAYALAYAVTEAEYTKDDEYTQEADYAQNVEYSEDAEHTEDQEFVSDQEEPKKEEYKKGEFISDGPIQKVSFSRPWTLPSQGETPITVSGFYYQSYNNRRNVFVCLNEDSLPVRAYHLSGPILQTLLSRKRVSGLPATGKLGSPAGTGLGRILAEAFALYGLPLSDIMPWPLSEDSTPDGTDEDTLSGESTVDHPLSDVSEADSTLSKDSTDDETLSAESNLNQTQKFAQRFARGWIVVSYH